MVFESLKLI